MSEDISSVVGSLQSENPASRVRLSVCIYPKAVSYSNSSFDPFISHNKPVAESVTVPFSLAVNAFTKHPLGLFISLKKFHFFLDAVYSFKERFLGWERNDTGAAGGG
ncbi:MAG: hypothetical protein ABI036_03365, partial [Fibrobacteria bacterium]